MYGLIKPLWFNKTRNHILAIALSGLSLILILFRKYLLRNFSRCEGIICLVIQLYRVRTGERYIPIHICFHGRLAYNRYFNAQRSFIWCSGSSYRPTQKFSNSFDFPVSSPILFLFQLLIFLDNFFLKLRTLQDQGLVVKKSMAERAERLV